MSAYFPGKTAIVTGSGTGIGAAIAHRLAAAGASVTLADKNEASAQVVCEGIIAAGGKATACKVDIRVPEEVQAMIDYSRDIYDPAHILINNAGLGSQKYFLDTLHTMLEVNVDGTFLCALAAARDMVAPGSGRIVNFSSYSGLLGSSE